MATSELCSLQGDVMLIRADAVVEVSSLESENKELRLELDVARYELWMNHGHPISALYNEDGEMQCSLCKMHDWKRNKLLDLLTSLHKQKEDELRFQYEIDLVGAGLKLPLDKLENCDTL